MTSVPVGSNAEAAVPAATSTTPVPVHVKEEPEDHKDGVEPEREGITVSEFTEEEPTEEKPGIPTTSGVTEPPEEKLHHVVLPAWLVEELTETATAKKNADDWKRNVLNELIAIHKEDKTLKSVLNRIHDDMIQLGKRKAQVIKDMKSLHGYEAEYCNKRNVPDFLMELMKEGKVEFVDNEEYKEFIRKCKKQNSEGAAGSPRPLGGNGRDGEDPNRSPDSSAGSSTRTSFAPAARPTLLSPIWEETGKRNLESRRFNADEPTPTQSPPHKLPKYLDSGMVVNRYDMNFNITSTSGSYHGLSLVAAGPGVMADEKDRKARSTSAGANRSRSTSRTSRAKGHGKKAGTTGRGNSIPKAGAAGETTSSGVEQDFANLVAEMNDWRK